MFDEIRDAALRVYSEMRNLGLADPLAFDAAVNLFRHRAPQSGDVQAEYVVADWICEATGEAL
ncbi:MAG TPA: hypothetical protein DDW95_08150 [Alphaproteobacteria bacterium]|jgi:hypothetical protein|nr:hypothetical protein [Alphaproteobacteria bacterium]HBA42292.1 hypothetical protein [Alphaproteobacteria bacterium]HBC55020.1 hypothetical protein [Alphaproteobacteria bacterium]HBF98505.1 hypothetical protein [Alphaproteobacteria bacterium]HCO91854.1 hypothetical protein [Alphaproteobacteria bacterium]